MMDKKLQAEVKKALGITADALDIADDWGVHNVQVDPPIEWDLECTEELSKEWCSTMALAEKLKELAAQL